MLRSLYVAQYTCEKLLHLGAKPVTLSDSGGYIYDEAGVDAEKLAYVMDLKNVRRGRISEYAEKYSSAVYTEADRITDAIPIMKWLQTMRNTIGGFAGTRVSGVHCI